MFVSRRGALGFLGGAAASSQAGAAGASDYIHDGDPLVEDIGAAERIGAADALRTIAQEATASACFLFHGVDPEASRAVLRDARKKFRRNYDAILLGNPAMNIIGREERLRTLTLLQELEAAWGNVDPLLEDLLAQPEDADALKSVRAESVAVFDATDHLVVQIAGQYSNPVELIQRDAVLIDISGRQARLMQEIAGHACAIWESENSALAKEALRSTMGTFNQSLTGLRHGLPALGLKPAPTQEIADKLDRVIDAWGETRGLLDTLLAGKIFSEDARADLFARMNTKSKQLEDLARAYVALAKQSHP